MNIHASTTTHFIPASLPPLAFREKQIMRLNHSFACVCGLIAAYCICLAILLVWAFFWQKARTRYRQWIANIHICIFESGQPLERSIEGIYLVFSILAINLAAPSITKSLIQCMSSLIGSHGRRWHIDNLSITFLVSLTQLNQAIRLCEVYFRH